MSSSDYVATATENASRLGYKHVCVNYLHLASHDYQYQEVISWLSVSGPLFVGIREVQEKVSERIEKALGLATCIAHWT